MSESHNFKQKVCKKKISLARHMLSNEELEMLNSLVSQEEYDRFDHMLHRISMRGKNPNNSISIEDEFIAFEKEEDWRSEQNEDDLPNGSIRNNWLIQKTAKLQEENEKLNIILNNHTSNTKALIDRIEKTNAEKKEKDLAINELKSQINELLGKTQQNRIDEKITDYVEGVKTKLDADDGFFIKMSDRWAIAGCITAIGAIISAFVTFFFKVDFTNITTTELIYVFTRGLLGIALLSWLSLLCFSNSKKYTHESIRRKDRQHALMFGEIFLQIYGSTATKEDAVNVFKDWNISGDSAFSDPTEHPPGVQTIIAAVMEKLSPSDKNKE